MASRSYRYIDMAADETRGYRQLPPRDGYSDTLVRRRLVIETQSYSYIDRCELSLACLTLFSSLQRCSRTVGLAMRASTWCSLLCKQSTLQAPPWMCTCCVSVQGAVLILNLLLCALQRPCPGRATNT